MRPIVLIALIMVTGAVAGCATTPSTSGLATPWGVAGIHSFKPQKTPEPNESKVDKQVAQLLDDASQTSKDANVRVAGR